MQIIGISGMPETQIGDYVGAQILDACTASEIDILDGDILVVTQKIISKSEGRVVAINDVEPSELAVSISEGHRRDPQAPTSAVATFQPGTQAPAAKSAVRKRSHQTDPPPPTQTNPIPKTAEETAPYRDLPRQT